MVQSQLTVAITAIEPPKGRENIRVVFLLLKSRGFVMIATKLVFHDRLNSQLQLEFIKVDKSPHRGGLDWYGLYGIA